VVVCDDASEDGTAEVLRAGFPTVRLLRRGLRGGFSVAANEAVAAAQATVVVLLNNDMEVRAGCFAALVDALQATPRLFAAVPSIVRTATGLEEARTRLLFRRGVVSTSIDGGAGAAPAYACGGAMAVSREAFLELGGFDPLFSPFYWEDVDLSYRARKRGRGIAFVSAARVDHDHGATIGARFDRAAVARVYERNRLLFTWKNLTEPRLWRRHIATLLPKALFDLAAHPAFVQGLSDAWGLRAAVMAKRRVERASAVISDRELLSA
jgi:GT2 family glycosyltransferase